MKRIFSPNNILNESLEINSEFEIAFANNMSNAIPINATIVIMYFNLIFHFMNTISRAHTPGFIKEINLQRFG